MLFSYVENKQYRLISYYFPSPSEVFYYVENKQYELLSYYFPSPSEVFYYDENKQYILLSNYNRILIFPPQFPTLPRKISAHLQTNIPSGSNTRIMRALRNTLNINNLISRHISPHCKKHHFGLPNGPFRRQKSTISHPKIGLITLRNGQYQKTK